MCATRISLAWPNAVPAASASAAAAIVLKTVIFPSPKNVVGILFGARLRLGPAPDRYIGIDAVALAPELDLRRSAGRQRGDEVEHRRRVHHRLAFDLEQHVARLH